MASSSSQRPQTSRPRGVCVYFNRPGGCHNGEMCKFLHGAGETLSPYDKNKSCKFYAAGFCTRGDNCWFRHVSSTPPNHPTINAAPQVAVEPALNPALRAPDTSDEDNLCCICHEKPIIYGLLMSCSHICCLPCIRGWRDPTGKTPDLVESGNTKKCPYCRTPSKLITPSSVFYPSGDPRKNAMIESYKASMARMSCKYFERSTRRYCPFGRDCFYQHKNRDGTTYVFPFGADYYLQRSRQRRRNHFSSTDYEGPVPGIARALAILRERLLGSSLIPDTTDQDESSFGLLEDILTSFGTNPPEDPASFSTALRLMSNIFGDDDDDDDESIEEDDDDELLPPMEPFTQAQTSSARTGSPSPLPLTRSYMTSVSTNRDPEPRPIVVNDPDDLGGVAVTTTVHVHHDGVEESSSGIDDEIEEEEEPYPMGEANTSSMRTSSGTDLSSMLHYRSAGAEYLPDQPPRPRSALPSYADDDHGSFAPSVVGSRILLQQQQTSSDTPEAPPPATTVAQSLGPATGSTSSLLANVHVLNDGEGRSPALQLPLMEAPAPTTATTSSSVSSESVRSADMNTGNPSLSAVRKELKRERSKSERERRNFVTDGRGRVVATADTDPDAAPSLFWTQPPTVPGHAVLGDESEAVDSSTSSGLDTAGLGPSNGAEAPRP